MVIRTQFWDDHYRQHGYAGYGNRWLHRFDQPLRLRELMKTIRELPMTGVAGARVLDIGCGTGDVLAAARHLGYSGVGIDVGPLLAEHARQRFRGDPKVTVLTDDITNLPIDIGPFDLITSATVLQHLTDPDELRASLMSLRSVTKPGGHLLVLEIAPTHHTDLSDNQSYLTERTVEEWRRAFDDTGWDIRAVRPYNPWGPLIRHSFGRLVDRLVALVRGRERPGVQGEPSPGSGRRSTIRRVAGGALRAAMWFALYSAYPADHWLRLRAPSRLAYYRIFVVQSALRGAFPESQADAPATPGSETAISSRHHGQPRPPVRQQPRRAA